MPTTSPPPPAPAEPRKRGGQAGNTNALTHGFYRKAKLTAHALSLIALAREHGNIADDIDLLRVEIARLIESGDYDPRALAALAKVLITAELARHRITGGDDKRDMMSALDAVLADVNRAYALKEA
jgi:hypothetical protein